VFYNHTSDMLSIGGGFAAGPPFYVVPSNIGSSDAYGLELQLKGVVRKCWRWGIGYRYESVDDHFHADPTTYTDLQHTTREQKLKLNLGWSNPRWEIDGYLSYQSAVQGIASLPFGSGFFLTPVRDYIAMDARIAYRLTD